MDCKKSTEFDDILCKLLKMGSAPPAFLLYVIWLTLCLLNHVSRYTKICKVAALFNWLDNLNNKNYRQVSVPTSLSKVFEKVSCVQMSSYFEFVFSKCLSVLGLDIAVKLFY